MTFSTTDVIQTFLGNGSSVSFDFIFYVDDTDTLQVLQQDPDTGEISYTYMPGEYTVVLEEVGGTVTFTSPPDDGTVIVVRRLVDLTQLLDIGNQGGFYPETVEAQFDKTIMGLQQIAEQVERTISVPLGGEGITVPTQANRAGKYWFWDPVTGAPSLDTPDNFAAPAQAAATRAQAWAEGTAPGGTGTKSAREIAEGMTYTGLTGTAALYASKLALAAASAPSGGQAAVVTDQPDGTPFLFNGGDLSAEVTLDPNEVFYVAPNSDGTGASGAWRRSDLPRVLMEHGGCIGNGTTDNASAMQQLLDTASALYPDGFVVGCNSGGRFRLDSAVTLPQKCTLDGITFTCSGLSDVFEHNLDITSGQEFTYFSEDVRILNCNFYADAQNGNSGHAIQIRNIIGFWFVGNTCVNVGGAFVNHAANPLVNAQIGQNPISDDPTTDPAVYAGFSATDPDYALNTNVFILNNRVECEHPSARLARLHYTRNFIISNNISKHAQISWTGGSRVHNEGGYQSMLRRLRYGTISNNYIEGVNGAIYGQKGQFITVSGNVAKNITDVSYDFEGCKDCICSGNIGLNAGNGILATFEVAERIKFIGNLCIQDGTGTDISDTLYDGHDKIGQQNGFSITYMASGNSANYPYVTVEYIGNTAIWTGPSDIVGRASVGPHRRILWKDWKFQDCRSNLDGGTSSSVACIGNEYYMPRAGSLDSGTPITVLEVGHSASEPAQVVGNRVLVEAVMPTGSYGIAFRQGTNNHDRAPIIIKDNEVSLVGNPNGNPFTYSLYVYGSTGLAYSRQSRIHVEGNRINTFFSPSIRPGTMLFDFRNNRRWDNRPLPSISDVSAWTVPLGIQRYATFETSSPAAAGVYKQVATADSIFVPDSLEWQATTAYALDDMVKNSTGQAYACTGAGTSGASEPTGTGTSITDGTVTWRYMGPAPVWAALSFDA